MKKIIHKVIDELDFFKVGVTFNFKNKEKTSTFLGKLFSLFIFILLTFTFFSSDLMERKNPNILNQELEIDKRPKLLLDETNYTLGFSISDDYNVNYEINSSIFSFEILQRNIKTDGSYFEIKNIGYHLCNQSDFLRMPEIYLKLKLNQSVYCLDNKKIELKVIGMNKK